MLVHFSVHGCREPVTDCRETGAEQLPASSRSAASLTQQLRRWNLGAGTEQPRQRQCSPPHDSPQRLAMISSNWQQLVKQRGVDPVNPAPLHKEKKRKLSACNAGVADTAAALDGHKASSRASSTASAAASSPSARSASSSLSASPSSLSSQPTLIVAMDCEMVGIGADGSQHALARCSIVNSLGVPLYDRYVQPIEAVTDYRTAVSGILPQHVLPANAVTLSECQREVARLLSRRVLVGHALHSDLGVLQLSHPRHLIRDTSRWKGLCPHRPRALRVLAEEQLGLTVQAGQHDSVEDARTALQLYMKHRKEWELSIKQARRKTQSAATKPGQRQQISSYSSGERAGQTDGKTQQRTSAVVSSSSSWSSEGPLVRPPLASPPPHKRRK